MYLFIIFGLWERDALLRHGEKPCACCSVAGELEKDSPIPESPHLLNVLPLDETSAVGVLLCWHLGKLLGSTQGEVNTHRSKS